MDNTTNIKHDMETKYKRRLSEKVCREQFPKGKINEFIIHFLNYVDFSARNVLNIVQIVEKNTKLNCI